MQRGQRESVLRGQPSGGLVFSQDLSRGLSDQFGMKPGLRPRALNLSKTTQAAPAAYVRAFSAYLIGLCIWLNPPSNYPEIETKRAHIRPTKEGALPQSIGKHGARGYGSRLK